MAKNLGTFEFAANFKVKAAEALDPRMVAASKADLINKANWPADGNTIYVYKGLIVDCGEDGVYRLINPELALDPEYRGWERIDAGGVKIDNIFTYKGSVLSYSLLPAEGVNIGDVYNIEKDFSIVTSSPLDDEIVKNYAAGTNVAWNGSEWDPLTGAIDLSNYVQKPEVSELRINVESNTETISELILQLQATNSELSNKVDIVEGSSLIPNEKLLLIDTTAEQVIVLQESVNNILLKTEQYDEQLITLTNDVTSNQLKINNLDLVIEEQKEQLLLLNNKIENSKLIAGEGLLIVENTLQIKLDPSESNILKVSENGLAVILSEDNAVISNTVDNKINEALSWDKI